MTGLPGGNFSKIFAAKCFLPDFENKKGLMISHESWFISNGGAGGNWGAGTDTGEDAVINRDLLLTLITNSL